MRCLEVFPPFHEAEGYKRTSRCASHYRFAEVPPCTCPRSRSLAMSPPFAAGNSLIVPPPTYPWGIFSQRLFNFVGPSFMDVSILFRKVIDTKTTMNFHQAVGNDRPVGSTPDIFVSPRGQSPTVTPTVSTTHLFSFSTKRARAHDQIAVCHPVPHSAQGPGLTHTSTSADGYNTIFVPIHKGDPLYHRTDLFNAKTNKVPTTPPCRIPSSSMERRRPVLC